MKKSRIRINNLHIKWNEFEMLDLNHTWKLYIQQHCI